MKKHILILIVLLVNLSTIASIFAQDPCYERVTGEDFSWSYSGSDPSVDHTFNQPGTNGGFVLDIFDLDNSFNMEINGTDLATDEIEFQSSGTLGINVRFVDGDEYEVDTSGAIWEMSGTAENPLIRVEIASNGDVTLWGSKTSGGPLFELELFDGNTLNTVAWNTSSSNTVVVSQNVVGQTLMNGTGSGLEVIPCEDIYSITKEGIFTDDVNADGYAQVGESIEYTFEIVHEGNYESVYNIEINDPVLSDDPIQLSAGVNMLGGLLTGDTDNDNNLDIGETWVYEVNYPVTVADIYWNKGVYNLATINCERDSGHQLPAETSTDPTPYQSGDQGWDPTRPEHTYVSLNGMGSGQLITNPMLPSKTENNN